jgi:hypothetical protein
MKLILLLFTLISSEAFAKNCSANQIRVWSPDLGYSCQTKMQNNPGDCVLLPSDQKAAPDWLSSFPSAIFQPKPQPWWASQGDLHYPNLHFPGAWKHNGINTTYYPGKGEVHALKPNIYIESIHKDKKFTFGFDAKEDLHFLATTPYLDEKNAWKGKIQKDKFEIEGTNYDYLFYDIRFPKDKMQWERGLCANREEAIKWMLKDLTDMKYPPIALQDFEEHWSVKIPDYPFYCIYPQYNKQLDEVLPVTISVPQTTFVRSLYVLVPHKTEPDVDEPQDIPFPLLDSTEVRPMAIIKHETMFKEWGVAFLGE